MCLPQPDKSKKLAISYLLCILTSKWVLHTAFVGRNHLFLHLNNFFCIIPSLTEEQESKKKGKHQNKTKNMQKNGVYQRICVTLKRWLTPKSWLTSGENVEKTQKSTKRLFRPENGMQSTCLLVEIHNSISVFSVYLGCK